METPGRCRREDTLTSSVAEHQVGKAPHVAQSDSISDAGEGELDGIAPVTPFRFAGG